MPREWFPLVAIPDPWHFNILLTNGFCNTFE